MSSGSRAKVVSIVGARPQFIKLAPLSAELRRQGFHETIIHTGQHYDGNMSGLFFEELDIPKPDVNLEVGSGSHGAQTGKMLIAIEEVLLNERPDVVLVYGDTNSTLAGALCASKLHIPLAHVEAGLRSFNREMPEEINRIVADHVSDTLLCPNENAVNNLAREGVTKGVFLVGDLMMDALHHFSGIAKSKSHILNRVGVTAKDYFLATVHRAENTNDRGRLANILAAFSDIGRTVVFPMHPRTKHRIAECGLATALGDNVIVTDPTGYLDMINLEQNALAILTDSGGIQKEAFWLRVPCITLRDETEWTETVNARWNVLAGANKEAILNAITDLRPGVNVTSDNGYAAPRICAVLSQSADTTLRPA
ncbi:MAG: non-hydrolyzing UDP-N-acetylglucosamine 2-epimerase [Candidatus Cryosericum sp.]